MEFQRHQTGGKAKRARETNAEKQQKFIDFELTPQQAEKLRLLLPRPFFIIQPEKVNTEKCNIT